MTLNSKVLFFAFAMFFGDHAQAALQTWRLEAIVDGSYPTLPGMPDFAGPGSTIGIDFVVDDSRPMYEAILAVTLNGQTTRPYNGEVRSHNGSFSTGSLVAQMYGGERDDHVWLIHALIHMQTAPGTITEALFEMGRNAGSGNPNDFVRILTYGLNPEDLMVIHARPHSLSPVPLPAAAWLLGCGLPMLLVRRRRVALA